MSTKAIQETLNASNALEIKVRELSMLSPLEYETVRETEAESLGVRIKILDEEVYKARNTEVAQQENEVVETITPWDESVDGVLLLDEIQEIILNHVVVSHSQAAAMSLWVMGTYSMDVWRIWPKLLISSPEKRCGKTTLLEVLEALVHKGLFNSNITPSAIFRSIELYQPTLLIDEADTFTRDNDEINGIINAGHTKRGATIIRTEKVGDEYIPRKFSVWAAQIIAGIGNQRDTLMDRAIEIKLSRKKNDEVVARLTSNFFEESIKLRRKCLRWAQDNKDVISKHALEIEIENCGNDRAVDNWRSLFSIAHTAGGVWPTKVSGTYQTLIQEDDNNENIGARLLTDIRDIFTTKGVTKIFSDDLVDALVIIEDSPWPEWKHGKPMSKISLSRLLKGYNIKTSSERIGSTVKRGYKLEYFQEAFDRYADKKSATDNGV